MLELRILGGLDLRREDGVVRPSPLTAPKRLALLAYLTLARPRGFHRRDSLLALFWPELDDRHARGSLRNLLHMLRRSLGSQVVLSRGDDEVGIDRGQLWCDAVAMDEALAEGRLEAGLDLYRGDLLEAFHADASAEFEHWLEAERARLRDAALRAAAELSDRAQRAGELEEALRWARWAHAREPSSERTLRQLLVILDAMGDRTAALSEYEQGAARLLSEYGLRPSPETQALVESIRHRDSPPAGRTSPSVTGSEPGIGSASVEASVPEGAATAEVTRRDRGRGGDARPAVARAPFRRRGMRWAALVVTAGLLVGGTLAVYALRGMASSHRAVTAVGNIRAIGDEVTEGTEGQLVDMLTSSLSMIPELQMVSPTRMAELQARVRANGDTAAPIVRAARLHGVDVLIEGTLHAAAGEGSMRLDLRRVELRSGRVLDVVSVRAGDLPTLAARATEAIAKGLRLAVPSRLERIASTTSAVAYRFYEEGVRAYYRGDRASARRLLATALREDSTFAMAAYYLAEASDVHSIRLEHFSRALRFADGAPERDALMIRAAFAVEFRDRSLLPRAESLVVRYPQEAGAHYLYGRALIQSGDHGSSIPYFARVIEMDSAGIGSASPRCRACDALHWMVYAYVYLDSIPAAEQTARRWVRLDTQSARAWADLAWTLWRQDRFPEAVEARKQAASRRAGDVQDELYPALAAVRGGDFAAADRFLRERITLGRPEVRHMALYWLAVSLRYQGRRREALAVAEQYRGETPVGYSLITREAPSAQVLVELGEHEQAAERFQRAAAEPLSRQIPGRSASRRLWAMTHLATAVAASGRFEQVAMLADSVAALGLVSELHRDRLLHYYVRGLLLAGQGRNEAAAGHFRRAIASPSSGYVRPKVELARVLLELGRAEEAIPVLQAALRGPIAAGGLYATRTEMHALLGDAWAAAGVPDSAAVHYRRVLSAWERADPELHERREGVRRRLVRVRAAGDRIRS